MKLIHLEKDGEHKLFSRVKWAADYLGTFSNNVNQALYHGIRVKGWFAYFDEGGSYNSKFIDTFGDSMTEKELKCIND